MCQYKFVYLYTQNSKNKFGYLELIHQIYTNVKKEFALASQTQAPRQLQNPGEAVFRRRWTFLLVLLVFLTLVLKFRFFTEVPIRFSLIFERRRSRRSPTRRRTLWSLFVVFPVTLSLRLVSASAMSREGSLTTALCRFTATLSVEPTYGCHRTGHTVDSVQSYQPPRELSYQLPNSLFPYPGRPEFDIPLCFAPFKSYDTRSISFTRV